MSLLVLLAVLDELNSHALTDGRVGLLSLNTNLLQNNSLGVRSSSEGIGLPSCSQVSLLVVLVGPDLVPPVLHVLPRSGDRRRRGIFFVFVFCFFVFQTSFSHTRA